MRKPIVSIALAGLFLASSLCLRAADAPAVNLVTVDVIKVMSSFWKKQNSENQIQEAAKAAQDYLQKEGTALDEIKKNLDAQVEQGQSPALTEDAKNRAMEDAKKTYAQLQERGQQAEQFKENKERELAQRRNNDNNMFFSEIRDAVLQIAKTRGATLVVDSSARSNVLYSDSAYDITDDVIAMLNKSMPADFKLQK